VVRTSYAPAVPLVCVERAIIDVQTQALVARMDSLNETLEALFAAAQARERPDDALFIQMQAQMVELEKARREANALIDWVLEWMGNDDLADCDARHVPRIS